ncbi:MAG: hypothetical protein Q9168_006718 [Polycauliona sp. 1 TL-2023]
MENLTASIRTIRSYGKKRSIDIVENLQKNRLWQRQMKNVATTTIFGAGVLTNRTTVSIGLIPRSGETLGPSVFLGALMTVFAHPGRRFGQMAEALILALAGTLLGLAWSLLGLYLSSLVVSDNVPAAYSIKGAFLAFAMFFHGFLRSNTPRLFVFVLVLIIVTISTLTSTASTVTSASATQILYPILTAAGLILLVNLFVYPEFSSSFLGETTIDTLHDAAEALERAGYYFSVPRRVNGTVEPPTSGDETEVEESNQATKQPANKSKIEGVVNNSEVDKTVEYPTASLQDLVAAKARLRSRLSICKAAQTECAFEVAFAVLPPRRLKPISNTSMKKLVANVVAVIGACESKFALLGEDAEPDGNVTKQTIDQDKGQAGEDQTTTQKRPIQGDKTEIDLIKPKREIEFGDVRLLQLLLQRITVPYTKLDTVISRAIRCVTVCIAYSYDVSKLPSGARVPKELAVEEVDLYLEELGEALRTFDTEIAVAFDGTVESQEVNDQRLDLVPREEIFLVASFVLNLRQAATHIEDMLKTSRTIILKHQARHGRRRFYAPKIKWTKWLSSGGEDLEGLPATSGKRSRSGEKDKKTDVMDAEENPEKSPPAEPDLEQGARPTQRMPKPHEKSNMTPTPASDSKNNIELSLRLRGRLADGLDWVHDSDDPLYAFKISVAVFLVTWPAFLANMNQWYSLNRGCE